MVKCKCGAWKVEDIPCWNETDRKQITTEAVAQLGQALRNVGSEIKKSIPFLRKVT